MSNNKQLILITAPFNCGYCETAKKELPSWIKENGWDYTEVEDDPKDALGADTYPTIMVRIKGKIVETILGYNNKSLLEKLNKY